MSSYICFDLEGPFSPQDNAYELMKLFPSGEKIFEVISRYDDLLTMQEKEGYEPGDTLSLIVPFLVLHGISEKHVNMLAAKATLTDGADKLISWLWDNGWKVFCITTSYEQYALHITQKLGIYAHNVACTPFPIDRMHQEIDDEGKRLLQQMEEEILDMYPPTDDKRIQERLDRFFWEQLPATRIGAVIKEVKPVGGRHKAEALKAFSEKYGEPLSKWVVVGDSITDFRMFQAADKAGGLAIAFNANEYSIPYATMSMASTAISDLNQVLPSWQKGSRKEMEKTVKSKEKAGGQDNRGYFHWLAGRDNREDIITLHKKIRLIVREEAGNLG